MPTGGPSNFTGAEIKVHFSESGESVGGNSRMKSFFSIPANVFGSISNRAIFFLSHLQDFGEGNAKRFGCQRQVSIEGRNLGVSPARSLLHLCFFWLLLILYASTDALICHHILLLAPAGLIA